MINMYLYIMSELLFIGEKVLKDDLSQNLFQRQFLRKQILLKNE